MPIPVTKIDPQNVQARINLGVTYMKEEMYSSAILEFKKAIEFDSQNPLAYKHLGVAYYQQGHYREAMENLQKAIEFDPQNVNLRSGLDLIQKQIAEGNSKDGEFIEFLE